MDEINQDFDPLQLTESMDIDDFLIKSDPEDDVSIPVQLSEDLPAQTSENYLFSMCGPKTESDLFNEENQSISIGDTESVEMCEPKSDLEMNVSATAQSEIMANISEPITAQRFSDPFFIPMIYPLIEHKDSATQLQNVDFEIKMPALCEPKTESDILIEESEPILADDVENFEMYELKSELDITDNAIVQSDTVANTQESTIAGFTPDPIFIPMTMIELNEPKEESVNIAIHQSRDFDINQPAPDLIPELDPLDVTDTMVYPRVISVSSAAANVSTSAAPVPDMPTTKGKSGRVKISKQRVCGVPYCGNLSKVGNDVIFFSLPTENIRRKTWLEKIGRMDVYAKPPGLLLVCERHFKSSDISHRQKPVKTKVLKSTAVPELCLPIDESIGKAVQARQLMFDNSSQTDYTNMETKAVQVVLGETSSLNTSEMKTLLAEYKKRLRSIDNGAHKSQIHAFNTWSDKFVPKPLAELGKAQATLDFHRKGNRYDVTTKAFSLNLFYTSRETYDLLCKDLCMPSSKTLKRMNVSVEHDENLMKALEIKIQNMSEREKYCSVIVDIMKIKSSLGYDAKKDRIVGLHEVNGHQRKEPAQYAIVMFVRGLLVNWYQPVALAFFSGAKRPSEVTEWIDIRLKNLIDIGLKIKTFVTNTKSDLLSERQQRSISVDRPYFLVNNIKIYYVFDVPCLLRELRDVFLDNVFRYRNENGVGSAKIGHITDLFQTDIKKKLRLAPKLTLNHLYPSNAPKNLIRYAIQLLSRSVATALEMRTDFDNVYESDGSRHTIDFLLLMNDLFDTLNSSSMKGPDYKRAYRGDKIQVNLLQRALKFFQTLQIFKSGKHKVITYPFIENFQITIKSVLNLFKELKREGQDYLFTRHLQLEMSTKFLKAMEIKSGNVDLTSKQFSGIFQDMYLTHILKPTHENNCSKELAIFLVELNEKEDSQGDGSSSDSFPSLLKSITDTDELLSQMTISEENNIADFCKLILKACLKHHSNCERLKVFVELFNSAYGGSGDGHNWDVHTPETISPIYFVSLVDRMEICFCEAYEALEFNNNVCLAAYEKMKMIEFTAPCPCFPTDYLKSLFIRLRMTMIVNFNTELYRKNHFEGKDVVVPKLTF